MNWASAELKVDGMKDEIKELKKTVKILELDLVKTKQNLGTLAFLIFGEFRRSDERSLWLREQECNAYGFT